MASAGEFYKVKGDAIYAADYNHIRDLVYNLKAVRDKKTMASSPVATGAVITADHWNQLKTDVDYCTALQGVVSTLPTKAFGSPVTIEDIDNFYRQSLVGTIYGVKYTIPGNYNYVVPAGVTSLKVTTVGAGGGGGGSVHDGDTHGAANGGSGGYILSKTVSVSPGEMLTLSVGQGGAGGTSSNQGARGGTSTVTKSGAVLYEATGGYGGRGVKGDNSPGNSNNGSLGGSPDGVDGSYTATWMTSRNTRNQGYDGKGQNPTGYGSGGLGGYSSDGLPGGDGMIEIRPLISILYTTAGTTTLKIPNTVTSIDVTIIGGGGGGSGGGGDNGDGGVGGFAGSWTSSTISVTPGDNITIVVGKGGAGGTGTAAGSNSMASAAYGKAGSSSSVTYKTQVVSAAGGRQQTADSPGDGNTIPAAENSYYTTLTGITTRGAGNLLGSGTNGKFGGGGGGGGSPHTGYTGYGNGGDGGDGVVILKYYA